MIDHDESESRSNNSFKWYPLLQHFATAVAPWTVIDHSLAGGDHCWPRLGLMAGCFWCELDFLDISNLAIISQLNVWGGVFYKKKMWFGIWSNKMGIICKNVWNNKVISRWNINNGWVSRCWSLFFCPIQVGQPKQVIVPHDLITEHGPKNYELMSWYSLGVRVLWV